MRDSSNDFFFIPEKGRTKENNDVIKLYVTQRNVFLLEKNL